MHSIVTVTVIIMLNGHTPLPVYPLQSRRVDWSCQLGIYAIRWETVKSKYTLGRFITAIAGENFHCH